jgi:uncharacterized protein (DUF1501 family)
MNTRNSRKAAAVLDRRQILLRGGCGLMSLTSAVNIVSQLQVMQGLLNAQGTGSGYNALVCVFLQGGDDGNNTLIAFSGGARTDYDAERVVLAIPTKGGTSLRKWASLVKSSACRTCKSRVGSHHVRQSSTPSQPRRQSHHTHRRHQQPLRNQRPKTVSRPVSSKRL